MKYIFRKKILSFLMGAVDAVGYAVIRFFWLKKKRRVSLFKRDATFLVVRLDHIGDILLATPIPRLIKAAYPESKVIFLCATWGAALLENNPYIDEIIEWNAPWFSRGKTKKENILKLVNTLKTKKIDVALCLRGDARENLIVALAQIPKRYGFGITGLGFTLTEELDYHREQHEWKHSKDILASIDVPTKAEWKPEIYFAPDEEKSTLEKLSERLENFWQKDAQKIAVQLRSGAPSKDWPFANYKLLFEKLLKNGPKRTIYLVGASPPTLEEKFLPQEGLLDLRGKLSLRELAVFLKHADLAIGPDSGPMHLASSLGVKTIFLYSATNELERWKPLASNAVLLRKEVPCSPCFSNQCRVNGHPCMKNIEMDEVLRAANA